MTTPTAARPQLAGGSSHWYTDKGDACHEVPKKGGGMRPTNLADARKLNLLPSVTTILKVVAKPNLEIWKQEQAALAVLTSPRKEGEELDSFVKRVLQEEKQHEQEAGIARDKGKMLHDGIEGYFSGIEVPAEIEQELRPVLDALLEFGQKASAEIILVGDDYAGQADLLQDCGEWWRLWDFKCTKSLPEQAKGAWLEHQLQLAAYAQAFKNKLLRANQVKPILVGNIYISTVTPGQYVICEHENWEETYTEGFAPLVRHWQFVNKYRPTNPNRMTVEKAQTDLVTHYQVETGKLKQELEDLRAKLAVLQQNNKIVDAVPMPEEKFPAPAPQVTEPLKDPGAPAVLPAAVQELVKSGKRVAWSSGTPVNQIPSAPLGPPVQWQPAGTPTQTGPGRPSPLIEKAPPPPPGVTPRTLVNGPNGPVMQ